MIAGNSMGDLSRFSPPMVYLSMIVRSINRLSYSVKSEECVRLRPSLSLSHVDVRIF